MSGSGKRRNGKGGGSFDSLNLNPQLFINEASEIVKEAVEEDKLDDLRKGVSSIRNVIQEVLDQRMGMWEKYCLRHCFAVPEGFSLPKARNSDDIVMDQDLLSDTELDHELDSLRETLYTVGKESSELQKELHDLKQQNSFSTSCADSVTEALQPYEQKSVHDMFEEMVKAAAKLHVKVENLKVKRSEKFNGIRTRKIYENAEDQFTVHRRKGFPEVELKDLQDFVADSKSL